MLANRLRVKRNSTLVIAPYYWSLSDGTAPYLDTGFAGQSRNMSAVGTVSNDAAFNGISLTGSGAVFVGDSAEWIDNIVAGAGKKFSLKLRFRLPELGQFTIFGKIATALAERQLQVITRTNGDLDFVWYGALNAASFRVIRTSGALVAGVTYVLDIKYDGTISTGNGVDRVSMYLNGDLMSTFLSSSQGSLPTIVSGPAPLAVGASVRSTGVIDNSPASGEFSTVALYDYLMPADQIGVF